jgi:hypothetical protein
MIVVTLCLRLLPTKCWQPRICCRDSRRASKFFLGFAREGVKLGGEAVLECVFRASGLAFGSDGSFGFGAVCAGGVGFGLRCHG